ncbi:MAG TPA: hypothetical protein VNL16_01545 [Chloroflexota bacterium]|nr:hypothetical protein [Chloroflexota bacterium]
MTCDEFRRRWIEGDVPALPRLSDQGGEVGDGLTRHRAGCAACAAWERGQWALDEALAAALVVAPPPALAARLAQIPTMVARTDAVEEGARPFELVVLVVAALGAIGLCGAIGAAALSLLWPVAADVLQAAPLVLGSPLIGYYQSVASTLIEALATLLLIALVVLQVQPEALRDAVTPSGRS